MSATSTPHPSIQPGAERLCEQAEALVRSLAGEDVSGGLVGEGVTRGSAQESYGGGGAPGAAKEEGSLELVVDGYAHVLALDVDRRRLEREVARIAEAGDPGMAARLSELSGLLRRMTRVSDELRARLDALRARLEGRSVRAPRRADRITP